MMMKIIDFEFSIVNKFLVNKFIFELKAFVMFEVVTLCFYFWVREKKSRLNHEIWMRIS